MLYARSRSIATRISRSFLRMLMSRRFTELSNMLPASCCVIELPPAAPYPLIRKSKKARVVRRRSTPACPQKRLSSMAMKALYTWRGSASILIGVRRSMASSARSDPSAAKSFVASLGSKA